MNAEMINQMQELRRSLHTMFGVEFSVDNIIETVDCELALVSELNKSTKEVEDLALKMEKIIEDTSLSTCIWACIAVLSAHLKFTEEQVGTEFAPQAKTVRLTIARQIFKDL